MTEEVVTCNLDPLGPGLKEIHLPDEEEVVVGQKRELGIVHLFCSTEQLTLKADYIGRTVTVKVNGFSPSWVDGKILKHQEKACAKHGSLIEIIRGSHRYAVLFKTNIKKKVEKGEVAEEEARTFEWEMTFNKEVLLCTTSDFDSMRNKVAGFDLEDTLVRKKPGPVLPKMLEDFELLGGFVTTVLTNLHTNGWKIIIFANHDTFVTSKGKLPFKNFKKNIEKILMELNVPCSIYISMAGGITRKPAPGMWELMKTKAPLLKINLDGSFYCGDDAGRPDNWSPGRKADVSPSDQFFALNIGVHFFTPDELFLKQPRFPSFDFGIYPLTHDITDILEVSRPDKQEVIVMAGPPASGKSFFVKTRLIPKGYEWVSHDDLGSWKKCALALKKFLALGRSVVVDNTNQDIASRQRYVEVCKELNVKVRCFCMRTRLESCLHNNMYRRITNPTHEIIASDLIRSIHSSFEIPTVQEGFSEIVSIFFSPIFLCEELKTAYCLYLLPE